MVGRGGASGDARRTTAATTAICLLVVGLVVLYVVLARAARDSDAVGLPGAFPLDAAASAAAGLVILRRRHNHPAGWILVSAGLVLLVQIDGVLLSIVHYRRHTDPLPLGPVAVLAGLLWVPLMAATPHAVARFPDGRIPLRGARTGSWIFAAVGVLTSAYFYGHAIHDLVDGHLTISMSSGDPVEIDTPHGALAWCYALWGLAVVGGLILAVTALVVKFRRSHGDTRQQLRWFIFGASLATAAVVPVAGMSLITLPPNSLANQLPSLALAVALVALPITIAIGILRFRLYELNVVIRRSVSYGLLAAGITAAYLVVVTLLGVLVGGGGHASAISILATLAAAAMFQPLRALAERLARRFVYGRRATPYEALSEFAAQLASTESLDAVLARAAGVLAEATAALRTVVWLRSDDDNLRAMATAPSSAEAPTATTLSELTANDDACTATALVFDEGDVLGAMTVTKRPSEPLTDSDRDLLHQLAAQAGLVLRNAKLSADLQRRLDELLASRQRLVAAQDEARRHLERDLHDGAQQQLIALNMRLGRLRSRMAGVDDNLAEVVGCLQTDVDAAIDTMRSLARGIYPSLLADKGLTAALQSSCRDAPIPVLVQDNATVAGRLPQDVEAAAYFCVLEALQNVFRHARAAQAVVSMRRDNARFTVEVTDDGCGFLPRQRTAGSGLTNISDRVEALRGRIAVRSTLGTGTTLVMEFPVRSTPNADVASGLTTSRT